MKKRRDAAGPVFEDLPVAAVIVDRYKRLLAISHEARRMTGATKSVIGSKRCRDLWCCRIPESRCPLKRAWLRRTPLRRAEVEAETRSGRCLLIERISAYRDPVTGERRAVIVTGNATRHSRRLDLLRFQARTDHLTRLLNRRHFEALVSRLSRRERRRQPCAFIMIDVDGLKAVNEECGHEAGDRLLRRLGRLLKDQTRRRDLAGRLGGDEFGIFCPATGLSSARELVRRLRAACERGNLINAGEPRLSFGVGLACRRELDSRRDMRAEADARLRRAKAARRLCLGSKRN